MGDALCGLGAFGFFVFLIAFIVVAIMKQKRNMWRIAWGIGVSVVLMFIGSAIAPVKKEMPKTRDKKIGVETRQGSNKKVKPRKEIKESAPKKTVLLPTTGIVTYLAHSPGYAFSQLNHFPGDETRILNLYQKGELFKVPAGTEVQVLDKLSDCVEVVITEGPYHKGARGFIPSRYIELK